MLLLAAALALGSAAGSAPQDQTLPPDTSVTALPPVTGRGVQVYCCQPVQGALAWSFVAPEATLYQGGDTVGSHSAGPTWRWKDGSAVAGRLLISQPAPQPGSIPWLLLAAAPTPDSRLDGVLSHVAYVRRSDTRGGSAPATGCDAKNTNAEARVPYEATYTFYAHPSAPTLRPAH